MVIVVVAGDVFLLPVPERNLENPDFRAGAGEAVTGACGNPDLITLSRAEDVIIDLHFGTRIKHDPEFGAAGMRLEAEALPGFDGHEAHCHFPVVGVLAEGAPGARDAPNRRKVIRDGSKVGHGIRELASCRKYSLRGSGAGDPFRETITVLKFSAWIAS